MKEKLMLLLQIPNQHLVHRGWQILIPYENKMTPTNPNAHTYVNGTDVKTHGYAACSHAQYLSAIVYLNSLVHVSLVTSLQCGV